MITSPPVVHLKREPFDIYIGRPGKWGNPFYLDDPKDDAMRTSVLQKYRQWIWNEADLMADALTELPGKTLGCWCAPRPCHGDILSTIANSTGELREKIEARILHLRNSNNHPGCSQANHYLLDTPEKSSVIKIWPQLVSTDTADTWMKNILANKSIHWQQDLVAGKYPAPRMTVSIGQRYRFSGIASDPIPWSPLLLSIKEKIESLTGDTFNSGLLNLYRNNRDSIGWHSDDERDISNNSTIGSLSLGATRIFELQHKQQPNLHHYIESSTGSYLCMSGSTQRFWRHRIAKTESPCHPRLNITFRTIKNGKQL